MEGPILLLLQEVGVCVFFVFLKENKILQDIKMNKPFETSILQSKRNLTVFQKNTEKWQ